MAGLRPQRKDEVSSGGILHKRVLELIIACDVFNADLTTLNPDVMYEVGIRHALRRGATVLLASRDTSVPYNISYSRYLAYEMSDDGRPVGEVDRVGRMLKAAIDESEGRNDSPIHDFFPDLHIELPEGLLARQRRYPRALRRKLSPTGASSARGSELAAIE